MNSQRLPKHAIGPTHIQVRLGSKADRMKGLQPLIKKLPLIPSAHKRKKWFSAMESHYGYQPQLMRGPMPINRWQTRMNSMIFLQICLISLFFGTFLQTGLLLYILIFLIYDFLFLQQMQVFVSCSFSSILFCIWTFSLLFVFLFFMYEGEKKHRVGWVQRRGKFRRKYEEKMMIYIYIYHKINFQLKIFFKNLFYNQEI